MVTQAWSLDGQHRWPEAVSPGRCRPVASSRRRGGEREGAPATQPEVCPAASDATRSTGRDPGSAQAASQREAIVLTFTWTWARAGRRGSAVPARPSASTSPGTRL